MRRTNLAVDCAAGEKRCFRSTTPSAIVAEGCDGRDRVRTGSGSAGSGQGARRRRRHRPIPLPPFDHAAVDGYGIAAADLDRPPPHRLALVGGSRQAGRPISQSAPAKPLRLFTGAADPAGCRRGRSRGAMQRRVRRRGAVRFLSRTVRTSAAAARMSPGFDDRRGRERFSMPGTSRSWRPPGLSEIAVRRRVRVAVLSTGDELRRRRRAARARRNLRFQPPDAGRASVATVDRDRFDRACRDDHGELAGALRHLAGAADVILSTGGAAGSDTDHTARAIVAAGGNARPLRVALRPGKPIVVGRIGPASVLGLPGNPVAAMVNFLLFGRALILLHAGGKAERPRGQPAVAATPMPHSRGRTEFAPGRFVGIANDGRPLVEKLGKGGSARLRPLVLADGFVEISAEHGGLEVGDPVAFHPFQNAFSP